MPRIRDEAHVTALGNRIRARRQWLGVTLEQAAAEVGVTYQQFSKYEGGTSDPSSSVLLRLAAVLKTSPAVLLDAHDGWHDPDADEAAALFADVAVSSIVRRLRSMSAAARKQAHALICTIRGEP